MEKALLTFGFAILAVGVAAFLHMCRNRREDSEDIIALGKKVAALDQPIWDFELERRLSELRMGCSVPAESSLINEDLLIDLGPDVMAASQMHGCPLDNVRYCLQTHPHADHLDLSHLLSRSPGFGVVGAPILDFYASRETTRRAAETSIRGLADYSLLAPQAEKKLNIKLHQVNPLEYFTVGPYSVMAFPANHAPGMGAMLYSVSATGSSVFYGTDTGTLLEETWQAFRNRRMQFDLVILDHTYSNDEVGNDHLSANDVVEHARRLRADGALKPNGRVFATHIAHEGNPSHVELAAFAKQHGYEVAHDGLILSI